MVRSDCTPFGFKTPNGSTSASGGEKAVLVEYEAEQVILAEILRFHEESGLGARPIAKALNEKAMMNPRTSGPLFLLSQAVPAERQLNDRRMALPSGAFEMRA